VYGIQSVRNDGVRLDDGFAAKTRLAHDGWVPHATLLVASLVSVFQPIEIFSRSWCGFQEESVLRLREVEDWALPLP
jgi:hypothetical protein